MSNMIPMTRCSLAIVASTAGAAGLGVGMMVAQSSCEKTAWWNPVTAFRVMSDAQSNPLIMLASPEATEAMRTATGAMMTTALGAVGFATHRSRKGLQRGDDEGEERTPRLENGSTEGQKNARRKRIRELMAELEEKGVYDHLARTRPGPTPYPGHAEHSTRASVEYIPAPLRLTPPPRVHSRTLHQAPIIYPVATPPRGGGYDTRGLMGSPVSTPIKIIYRNTLDGSGMRRRSIPHLPGHFVPPLSMHPRGHCVTNCDGPGYMTPWGLPEYSHRRALDFGD